MGGEDEYGDGGIFLVEVDDGVYPGSVQVVDQRPHNLAATYVLQVRSNGKQQMTVESSTVCVSKAATLR